MTDTGTYHRAGWIKLLLAGLVLFYSCKNDIGNETDKVNAVINKLIEADNNADIEAIVKSYTDSIEFYPAGKDFMKGIATIRANYEKLLKDNRLEITTRITGTTVVGNNAIVTGVNKGVKKSLFDSSRAIIDDKYIAILVRSDNGEWKIDKLIWGIYH